MFKNSQYKFNSGGDPKAIPDLKYEELLEFHQKYYHPSNSTFLTYGDLDFTEHLAFIQDYVLENNFENINTDSSQLVLDDTVTDPAGLEAKVKF